MWPHAPLWLVQLIGKTNLPVVAAVCVSAPVLAADALQPGDSPELHHHPQHQHLLSQHQPLDLASVRPHCPHLLQDRSEILRIFYRFTTIQNELTSSALLINLSMLANEVKMSRGYPWSISIYFCKVISTPQLPPAITWGHKWPSILRSGCTPNNLPWSIDKSKVFTLPKFMVTKPTIVYDQASQFHVYSA